MIDLQNEVIPLLCGVHDGYLAELPEGLTQHLSSLGITDQTDAHFAIKQWATRYHDQAKDWYKCRIVVIPALVEAYCSGQECPPKFVLFVESGGVSAEDATRLRVLTGQWVSENPEAALRWYKEHKHLLSSKS